MPNITLSVDDDIAKRVRKIAIEKKCHAHSDD